MSGMQQPQPPWEESDYPRRAAAAPPLPEDTGPVCGRTSPGIEDASVCQEPPGHTGKHHGVFGESFDDEGNTDLAELEDEPPDDAYRWRPEDELAGGGEDR